jgi:hypothetical protein
VHSGKLRGGILDPEQGAVFGDVRTSSRTRRKISGEAIGATDRMPRLGADEMDLAGVVAPDRDITVSPRP